jgi:orotate phosphoribosyltransferase
VDAAAARARLLELLHRDAYAERDLTLASGQKSYQYVDCKEVTLTGEGHDLVGRCFLHLLDEVEAGAPHDACGGMSMGADPLCSALSLIAFQNGRELNALFVRKEPKGHGTGRFLEGTGRVKEGARVVVLEDVVTTGGSSLQAVERLRDGGFVVDTVLGIVDRKAGGTEKLAAAGLQLTCLFDLDTVARGPA